MASKIYRPRVFRAHNFTGRYIVATETPDGGKSTFPECWGTHSSYDVRAMFASDILAEAKAKADEFGTSDTFGPWAYVIDRTTGKKVSSKRLCAISE